MSIRTIRGRLEKLEELTLQRPGVAVILPTEDGFIASRGDGKPARLCNTLGQAHAGAHPLKNLRPYLLLKPLQRFGQAGL